GLVLATGSTPCASAIIILLFALGQGVYLVGVAASLVMAIGMGLTVSLVGLAAVTVRRSTLRAVGPSAPAYWAKTALGVAGAVAIFGLGLVLFLMAGTAAWPRRATAPPAALPKREAKRFHARLDELHLELAIGGRSLLAHELVRSLACGGPLPLFVDVRSVGGTGRLPI